MIPMTHEHPTLLWKTWLNTAAGSPQQPVLIDAENGHTLKACDLTERAEAMAKQFTLEAGKTAAFGMANSVRWLITFLAIQRNGGAVMPLDSSLGIEAQRTTAKKLEADVLWQNGMMLPLNIHDRKAKKFCVVKVTSGTTGELNPVHCAAEHLLEDGKNIIATMGIRRTDRNLAIIPLGHSYGLGNLVMPLILQGTAIVCAGEFTPRQVLSWIEQHRVTVLPTVPAVFRLLCDLEEPAGLKPLRLAISAGAPLPPDVAQKFHRRFGIKIHNFYGSSETGGIAYDRSGAASLTGRSIGEPLSGVKVSLDSKGRVIVRSKAAVNPRGTLLADLGGWNGRGELKLLGRAGAVANIAGKKVHPAEVEDSLRAIKGISDVWVTVLRDPRGRDYLAAAVETRRKLSQIEAELSK
jgi:acyl-coenzyme A synthetase/AMP-(fatty) acid ligase